MLAAATLGRDVGVSFLAFAMMAAVLAWFWWGSRDEQLRRVAGIRPLLFRVGRTEEEDFLFQRRFTRVVHIPLALLLTAMTFVFLVVAVVRHF